MFYFLQSRKKTELNNKLLNSDIELFSSWGSYNSLEVVNGERTMGAISKVKKFQGDFVQISQTSRTYSLVTT